MKFILFCLVFAHIEAIQVSLSLARSNLAATSVNNLAIFAGGNSGTTTDQDATVDIFNSDGILINTTYLSVPRRYLAATSTNGLAMFAGGSNSNEYFNSVDVYDSSSGLWTTSSLSEPRAILSATTVGNLAIFAGGQNSSGPSDRVDIFNATSGQWTSASLSEPRIGAVATTVGNFALFGGGSNATGLSSRVDIYDATSGKWETASLSEARNWLAATSGGELALFGGGQNAVGESARVDIFNATSKMWTTAALSQARSFFAATTVGDLAIFGCGSNGNYLYTSAVDILNVKTNTWTTTTMTPARGSLAATSFGDLAWFGGGYMNQQGNYGPASAVNIFSLCNNDTVTQQTLNCNPVQSTTSKTWIYIVSAICGALLIAVGVVVFIVVRRRNGYKLLSQSSLQLIQNVSILERIGGGQFGDVYRGTMEESIDVALKKLKSETDIKEFEREAEILCALNHPNIVRFYGIHKSLMGQKYIVLEYMSEGALNHFLQRTRLQIYDLLTIAKHVIAGMRYLGENRIIHRDLACRNLLVAKEQKYIVKVGDFGMSRSAEKGYYTNNETKIPFKWSAPELIQYGTSTVKGDVWSFGVCLWEIFSLGKTPYATWSNRELMQKLVSGERLEQPENCPDKVYELMQSCWQLDPMARPSFEELGDLLQKYMQESYQQESYIVNATMLTTPSGSTTEMSVYN